VNQIIYSFGFASIILQFSILEIIFFISCSMAMNEKEKSIEILNSHKMEHQLRKKWIFLLPLESNSQKLSCGLFEFNMKFFFEVSHRF
jgi:hypothetical protein